jgi:ApaG protein
VSVIATYRPEESDVEKSYFVFSYEITIVNLSEHDVQLLSRQWTIHDFLHGTNYVEGQGVIGQQPIIMPTDTFIYSSWTPLHSSIGLMEGSYLFQDLKTGEEFYVNVPPFHLIPGFKRN